MSIIGEITDAIGTAMGAGAKMIGKSTWSGIKRGFSAWDSGVKTGVMAGAKVTANIAKPIGKGAKYLTEDFISGINSKNRGINFLGNAADLAYRAAPKLAKGTYETVGINKLTGKLYTRSGGIKFTPLGAGILLGAGALGGIRNAKDAYMDDRVGEIDPNRVTNTPNIPKEEYSAPINNGGATGDLVFALHANRRG